jgi:Skp family chaperone for outer membrane proteins
LQGLTIDELEIKIQVVATRRAAIQEEIQGLDKKRREFKAKNRSNEKESSLQESVITNINKLAKEKGYEVKE